MTDRRKIWFAIAYRLNGLRSQVLTATGSAEAERLSKPFDELVAEFAAVEQALRSPMFSLEQSAASQSLLLDSVDAQIAALKQHASAEITVAVAGDVGPRMNSQRIALERVLGESLSNVAKHAAAEHVPVRLRGTGASFLLQVADDGCGFNTDAASGDRVGLLAKRERLRLIGGRLSIDSQRGGPIVISALIEKWQPGDSAPVRGSLTAEVQLGRQADGFALSQGTPPLAGHREVKARSRVRKSRQADAKASELQPPVDQKESL